jgi:hypothetical protein
MLGDMITLYYPGDGVEASSNCCTYKGIKEFRDHGNGTISFKTKKHGEILTPLPWRLKQNVDLNEADEDEIPAAPAGNQAPAVRRRW